MDQHQWWLNRLLEKAFHSDHILKETEDMASYIDELVEKGLLKESDGIYYELTEQGEDHVIADLWEQFKVYYK